MAAVKSKMVRFLLTWTQQYTQAQFCQILHAGGGESLVTRLLPFLLFLLHMQLCIQYCISDNVGKSLEELGLNQYSDLYI